MNSPADIQLFITGGTIDKNYHETRGELLFSESYIPSILKTVNSTLNIRYETLMLKDSLEMDNEDRNKILAACQQTSSSAIVITHGTDTMTDTALCLMDNSDLKNKVIVLTGAMRPYKLGDSDASFNLGAAFMAVQTAQPGVYISMNGRLFQADKVTKNRQAGLFEQA